MGFVFNMNVVSVICFQQRPYSFLCVRIYEKHNNKNKNCIYVKNLTRNKTIAFKGKVMYFGGSLLMLLPKEEDLDIDKIVKILNNEETKKNYIYANRFKIGHRQLSSLLIKFN